MKTVCRLRLEYTQPMLIEQIFKKILKLLLSNLELTMNFDTNLTNGNTVEIYLFILWF